MGTFVLYYASWWHSNHKIKKNKRFKPDKNETTEQIYEKKVTGLINYDGVFGKERPPIKTNSKWIYPNSWSILKLWLKKSPWKLLHMQKGYL